MIFILLIINTSSILMFIKKLYYYMSIPCVVCKAKDTPEERYHLFVCIGMSCYPFARGGMTHLNESFSFADISTICTLSNCCIFTDTSTTQRFQPFAVRIFLWSIHFYRQRMESVHSSWNPSSWRTFAANARPHPRKISSRMVTFVKSVLGLRTCLLFVHISILLLINIKMIINNLNKIIEMQGLLSHIIIILTFRIWANKHFENKSKMYIYLKIPQYSTLIMSYKIVNGYDWLNFLDYLRNL